MLISLGCAAVTVDCGGTKKIMATRDPGKSTRGSLLWRLGIKTRTSDSIMKKDRTSRISDRGARQSIPRPSRPACTPSKPQHRYAVLDRDGPVLF